MNIFDIKENCTKDINNFIQSAPIKMDDNRYEMNITYEYGYSSMLL